MQWKLIYLARRNPALTAAQFPQAWREHSAKGRQCRNVQDKIHDVSQCARVLDFSVPELSLDYDGVGVMCLRDFRAATEIWSDAETLAIMRPDEPRVFSTYVRNFTLVCEEYALRDVPRGGAVLFGFLRCRTGLSRAGFEAAWLDDLDDNTNWLKSPAFAPDVRVVHNAIGQRSPKGYEYDGVAEWWFDSAATLKTAVAEGVRAMLPSAYGTLLDWSASVFVATQVTHGRA